VTTSRQPQPQPQPQSPARPVEQAERQTAAHSERKRQRIYIKITTSNEHPDVLEKLKELLASHHGQLDTVLFYEREQRSIALSETYRTKPSPQLFSAIEQLLGQGAVIVR
jgi:DNA polymerase-3 subunit alpha